MARLPWSSVGRKHWKRRPRNLGRALALESLEDRRLLSTVTLNPVKDNTLYENSSGSRSNGTGDIFVGQNNDGNFIHRGLLAFDVAGAVPAGATIDSVTLTMYVNRTRVGNRDVELHKVLADWGEAGSSGQGQGGSAQTGDATWLHTFYNNQFWASAGGDFSSTVSGVQAIGGSGSSYTWTSTAQMVTDVQSWLDNPGTNFGWLLKGDETQRSAKRLGSRETGNASQRPQLTVNYTEAAVPELSIDDVILAEGDAGTTDFTFTVTLNGAAAGPVSVDYATANGTATSSDGDYTAKTDTLNFAGNNGEQQTITVAVNRDQKVELDETFFVNLSNPSGATIADNQGQGTITNDDAATLSIDDVQMAEGDTGTTDFIFTVTLDAAVDVPVSVNYATANGSATTADNDYTAKAGTLNFAGSAGEQQTVTVSVNGDTDAEPNETFLVNLSGVSANGRNVTIADNQGQGTITNDDAAALSIDDVSMAEGDTGTTDFIFTVTLSAAAAGPVSVQYATADGSATTADNDYTAKSGTLDFAGNAGEQQTITVSVNGDTTEEPDQTFFVNLSNPSGAVIADDRGQGTIVDDDFAAEDLGPVGFVQRTGLDPTAGELWFRFDTTLDGTLTLVASDPGATLALYDASRNPLDTSTLTDGAQRIDRDVLPSETYYASLSGSTAGVYLLVVNQLNYSGTTATVTGIDGADHLEVSGSGDYAITVNGVTYSYTSGQLTDVAFNGGGGNDVYALWADGLSVAVSDTAGVDQLDFSGASQGVSVDLALTSPQTVSLGNTLTITGTVENILATDFADELYGNDAANQFLAGRGEDLLSGRGGNDFLAGGLDDDSAFGGTGDDTVYGGYGNDSLYGREGADFIIGNAGDDTIRGEEGDDTMLGGAGEDFIFGEAGNDVLRGQGRGDFLYGGAGNDHLFGNAGGDILFGMSGNDTVRGGDGDDYVAGNNGNDVVFGEEGDDRLFGGYGFDLLIGGRDSDALNGQTRDDILIGGTTIYDFTDAALLAIIAEWAQLTPIDTRVSHLQNGGGLNDPYLLDPASTVSDDFRPDTLTGGPGADWFLPATDDVQVDKSAEDR